MSKRSKSLLAVALAVGLGGCASGAPIQTAEESAATEESKNCVRDTGTRIKPAEGKCVSGPGRVYTAEDLQQSGSPTVSDALRRIGR